MRLNKKLQAAFFVAAMASTLSAYADSIQGTVDVRLTIERGCTVTQGGGSGSTSLGTMDFGEHIDLSQPITAGLVSAGAGISLRCNGVIPSMKVYYGTQYDLPHNIWHMMPTSTHSINRIAYKFFSDQDASSPIEPHNPIDIPLADATSGEIIIPLFAKVEPVASLPAPGVYRDKVIINIGW